MRDIQVQAADSRDSLEQGGYDVCQPCETIREAKDRAEHFLSEEFSRLAERSSRLGYARIIVNGKTFDEFGE